MSYRRALSVRTKLAINVTLVHLVLMTFFVVDVYLRQKDFLTREAETSTVSYARLISENISSWLLSEDVMGMDEVLRASVKNFTATYAGIIAQDGQVLIHSDRTQQGRYITDPEAVELLQGRKVAHIWRTDPTAIHAAAPVIVQDHCLGWVLLGADLKGVSAQLSHLRNQGIVYTAFAMIIGAVAAVLLASSIFRQIRLIMEGVARLRSNDLSGHIPIIVDDEIGHIASALNGAMESLHSSRNELKREIREHLEAEERIHLLTRRIMMGNEEERRRIGHDLHDEFGQSVAGFVFGLHTMHDLIVKDQAGASALCAKLTEYAERLGEDIRRVAAHQYPVALEHLGLPLMVKAYLQEHAQQHPNILFTSRIVTLEKRLEPYIELTAFRILQEAMGNIIRHSEATEVKVTLDRMHEWILLSIEDNGKGFQQQEESELPTNGVSGIGLLGMSERANSVEGYLEVISAPGKGCAVDVFLPLIFKVSRRKEGRHV
jgi:signal transduction histidine kinase